MKSKYKYFIYSRLLNFYFPLQVQNENTHHGPTSPKVTHKTPTPSVLLDSITCEQVHPHFFGLLLLRTFNRSL